MHVAAEGSDVHYFLAPIIYSTPLYLNVGTISYTRAYLQLFQSQFPLYLYTLQCLQNLQSSLTFTFLTFYIFFLSF